MTAMVRKAAAKYIALAWAVALAAILAWPWLTGSASLGDDLVRHTVRLTLVCYAAALSLLLVPQDVGDHLYRQRIARLLWTLAWLAYLVHLGMAFHFYHGWSHEHAVAHVEARSGWGPGIFISHLFTLVWTLDVAWWWFSPVGHFRRAAWISRLLHAFMLFITFNATVVYESGLIRWAGIAGFVWLGGWWFLQKLRYDPLVPAEST